MFKNNSNLKRYLLWFANDHADFRFNEIKSISELLGIKLQYIEQSNNPYLIVEVDSEENIQKIAKRSVLLRFAVELWADSTLKEKLHEKLKSHPSTFFAPFSTQSFKIKVEVFGSSQSQQEKIDRIESFSYLPLTGPVKLKNPELPLQYIEYYGLSPNYVPEKPYRLFFGRIVSESNRSSITKLSLKNRKFIGNTSMDPQLSLIMANQAHVRSGDIVLDPFVGSGSLLVAAANFGAYVYGADIDYLMIHGKTRPSRKQDRHKPRKDENIYNNMVQYGLNNQYLDVVIADSSLPFWRPNFLLDSIITDPPYGVREPLERVGCAREEKKIEQKHLKTHIPSKVQYSLHELISDLLVFAVKHLKLEGRLVTWIPVIRCEYDESKLPKHSCLEIVGNSEQILSTNASRRLLTYEKIKEPEENDILNVEERDSFRERYQYYIEENKKQKKGE